MTITSGIPNLASGAGGSGQATYTCGGFGPPLPVPISFDQMPELPCPPGPTGPPGSCRFRGRPVNVTTGEEQYSATDLSLSAPFGLSFSRTYDSLTIGTQTVGPAVYGPTSLGNAGWQTNYDAYVFNDTANSRFVFHDESGQFHYLQGPATAGHAQYNSLSAMTFAINAAGTLWTVTSWDGRVWNFNSAGALVSRADRIGNLQTVVRDATAGHNGRIARVTDPLGRELCFFYDASNRITAVAWQGSGTCPATAPASGTVVKMAYDSGTNCSTGQLCSVTEPDGRTWRYQYNLADPTFPNGLTGVLDPYGQFEERNTYAGGQVVTQSSGNCTGAFPCGNTGKYLRFSYPNNGANQTIVTDGLGRTTTFTYDIDLYLLLGERGPLCGCGGDQTRTYGFDPQERLQSVSDDGINGSVLHTIRYAYNRDAGGYFYPSPTSRSENLDVAGTTRTVNYTYYPLGQPQQDLVATTTLPSVDKSASTESIEDTYSTAGLLTKRTRTGYVNGVSTSYTWQWSYDARGRILTATGPRATTPAEITRFGYFPYTDGDHARAGQLETVTDALGHVTAYGQAAGFSSYDVFGDPLSATDPSGVVTEFSYDARGRKLSSTLLGVPGDTAKLVTAWTYDAAGRLTKTSLPAGNATLTSYDSSDRPIASVRIDAAGRERERLALAYGDDDRVTSRRAQSCGTPAPSCATWSTAFSETYLYSPVTADLRFIVNADGTKKSFTYDDAGPLATFNDENHPTGSDYSYGDDLAGRRLTEKRVLGGSSIITRFSYDLHDNVARETDPNGNETTYHHDDFDRVTAETSPVSGTTTSTFDADSNLSATKDANGATTTYAYDALNRPLSETANGGGQTLATTFKYDDPTAGHFGIGRLQSMSDPSGSTGYAYERRGNVSVENRNIVGNDFTVGYAYDANANAASLTYPDGYVVATGYDFADRPDTSSHSGTLTPQQLAALGASGVAAPANPAVPESKRLAKVVQRAVRARATLGRGARPRSASDNFVTAASYEPFGPIGSMTFGNGTVQTFAWNARYLPVENKLSGASPLADYGYAEDAAGNITGIADKLNSGYNRAFLYDDLNRLTTANSGASLWGSASGNGYSYDAMGDIERIVLGSTRSATFKYRPGAGASTGLPELASVVANGTTQAVAYDACGNERSDGLSTFAYGPRELLGSDSRFVSAYYYDGNRRRVAAQLNGGSRRDYFFDRSRQLVAETGQFTTASPVIGFKYVWLGDRPVAQVDSGGTHWTFADHLGTPLVQTDANGAISWQAEYEPYGEIWTVRTGSTLHQPLRFPGQGAEQFDTGNNGLTERSYSNARWYRPAWGRYTQADPAGLGRGVDPYRYADDGPIVSSDPSGQMRTCEPPQISTAIVAGCGR